MESAQYVVVAFGLFLLLIAGVGMWNQHRIDQARKYHYRSYMAQKRIEDREAVRYEELPPPQ